MSFAPLERTLELPHLVAYGSATWDWHRMHYDHEWARENNVPAPVVDGQMLGALMAEHVLDHYGPDAFITNLGFRFTSMVFAGDTVRCESEETARTDGVAEVAQRVLVGDRLCAEGSAKVKLSSGGER